MVNIKIDRNMILTELYELRATITNDVISPEESANARLKIDNIISIVQNAPVDDSGLNLPKISIRRK